MSEKSDIDKLYLLTNELITYYYLFYYLHNTLYLNQNRYNDLMKNEIFFWFETQRHAYIRCMLMLLSNFLDYRKSQHNDERICIEYYINKYDLTEIKKVYKEFKLNFESLVVSLKSVRDNYLAHIDINHDLKVTIKPGMENLISILIQILSKLDKPINDLAINDSVYNYIETISYKIDKDITLYPKESITL